MLRVLAYPAFATVQRDGVSPRSRRTELMLNCARIGYNP
jgi:hypothetical protein